MVGVSMVIQRDLRGIIRTLKFTTIRIYVTDLSYYEDVEKEEYWAYLPDPLDRMLSRLMLNSDKPMFMVKDDDGKEPRRDKEGGE